MSLPPSAADTAPCTAPSVEPSNWFAEEVQPHEAALKGYLHGAFPAVRDVDDVVQESYLRIWKARATQPIQSVRAFLFSIARRLAIDAIRREKTAVQFAVKDSHSSHALDSGLDPVETVSTRQEIVFLSEAIHLLPARCREIIILRKLEGLSHREIATRLGISEATIDVQLARGMEKCAEHLRRRGVISRRQSRR